MIGGLRFFLANIVNGKL